MSGCFHVPTEPNDTVSDKGAGNTATTTIDTSDWKTYTNDEYGFSFKYPKNFQITKKILESATIYEVKGRTAENQPLLALLISILPESKKDKHKYGFVRQCTGENQRISYETCVQIDNRTLRYIVDPGIDDVNFFGISNFINTATVGNISISIVSQLWLSVAELTFDDSQLQLDQIVYNKAQFGVTEPHNQRQIEMMHTLITTFTQGK